MSRPDDNDYRTGQKNEAGRTICGSRRHSYPRNKQPCQSTILMPNGRCRIHGGTTPRGPASPHYRTGEHSKYVPAKIARRLEKIMGDPDYLSLWQEIQLLHLRLGDLLVTVDQGGNTKLWHEAMGTYHQMYRAMKIQDKTATEEHFLDLGNILKRGASEAATWSEIRQVIQEIRTVKHTEHRMTQDHHDTMRMDALVILLDNVVNILKRHSEVIPLEQRNSYLTAVAADVAGLLSARTGNQN